MAKGSARTKGMRFCGGVAIGAIASCAAIAAGASGILYARNRVRRTCRPFYANAQRRLVIPGLTQGFDPQDLFFVESANVWLFSGYDPRKRYGRVSPIFRVDQNGNATRLAIELPGGGIYKGHGAAVCATDEHVFLTVEDGFVVLNLEEVLESADGATVRAFEHIPVELEPAFMNIQDDVLYIGEFYHKRFYDTPKSHWVKCQDGSVNPALMYAYDKSNATDSLFGFAPRPTRVYSIPKEIQGMCVTDDGRIVLSQSWGFGDSSILAYKPDATSKATSKDGRFEGPEYLVAGERVPLICLDGTYLQKVIKIPPMSEGIDTHDGEVWIASESASDLYILGKFNDGKYVYSLAV